MKHTIRIGLFVALLGTLVACVSKEPEARPRPGREPKSQPSGQARLAPVAPPRPVGIRPELTRAVWVDAWGSGFETPDRCDELIAWCLERGINTILVQVRRTGDAFYASDLEPRGSITGVELAASFDPLLYLVERAHDLHGLRVEAWMVAQRLWQSDAPPAASTPEHLLTTHADWLMINRDGKSAASGEEAASYLDPALPAVRSHLARIAADIARRYRVDAIHLDYIRYPDRDWGYGPASIDRFRKDRRRSDFPAAGDEDFVAWRAQQVEATVAAIRQAVRAASPDCELTAAVVVWGDAPRGGFETSAGYRAAFQDWPSWCRKGLVDAIYPMHYRRDDDPKQNRAFRDWLSFLADQKLGAARLVVGLGAYLNDQPSTGAQVAAVSRNAAFAGYALFSYRSPRR